MNKIIFHHETVEWNLPQIQAIFPRYHLPHSRVRLCKALYLKDAPVNEIWCFLTPSICNIETLKYLIVLPLDVSEAVTVLVSCDSDYL
jgi:hypothetical protein